MIPQKIISVGLFEGKRTQLGIPIPKLKEYYRVCQKNCNEFPIIEYKWELTNIDSILDF